MKISFARYNKTLLFVAELLEVVVKNILKFLYYPLSSFTTSPGNIRKIPRTTLHNTYITLGYQINALGIRELHFLKRLDFDSHFGNAFHVFNYGVSLSHRCHCLC
jgi:hypothetical protein